MKAIILTLALLTSGVAVADVVVEANGASIHFQDHATWVNAYFSWGKSLCHNGTNYYAKGSKCVERRMGDYDDHCRKRVAVNMVQPIRSTRTICSKPIYRNDDGCAEYKEVPHVQSPTMVAELYGLGDQYLGTETVTVPMCD